MDLSIRNLTLSLNNEEIIKDISFDIKEKELTTVLGLNGAGKTTLIKSIVGLIKPSAGSIHLNHQDANHLSMKKRSKCIAYVPQNTTIEFDYKVFDFVLMGITPHLGVFETPTKKHYQKVHEALIFLNLLDLKEKKMTQISGGERQLVFLARAWVQGAKIMILDEPNAHLDYKAQHLFLSKLKTFIKETNKSALISLHDPNLALKYSDKIIIIHNNKIINTIACNDLDNILPLIETLNEIYNNQIECYQNNGTYMIGWKE